MAYNDYDTVELHYDDLYIEVCTKGGNFYTSDQTATTPDYGYSEWMPVEYTYELCKCDIADDIEKILKKVGVNVDKYDDNGICTYELYDYIVENFDELFAKYESAIKEMHYDEAVEEAEEKY